eukprot:3273808-Rhodomonas_salina.1
MPLCLIGEPIRTRCGRYWQAPFLCEGELVAKYGLRTELPPHIERLKLQYEVRARVGQTGERESARVCARVHRREDVCGHSVCVCVWMCAHRKQELRRSACVRLRHAAHLCAHWRALSETGTCALSGGGSGADGAVGQGGARGAGP